MFGMNRKDADGLLEDAAMLQATQRNAYRGPTAEDLRRDDDLRALRSENFRLAAREIGTNDALNAMKAKCSSAAYLYNDANSVATAARATVDALADQLAKETGRDSDEVRKAAYAVMAKVYDDKISNLLSTGILTRDPRTDPEVKARRLWCKSAVSTRYSL